MPTDDLEYQEYLSWFFYICTEVDLGMGAVIGKYLRGCDEAEICDEFDKVRPLLNILVNKLGHNKHIVGNKFSACDIFLVSQLALMNKASLINEYPNLLQYIKFHQDRDSAIAANVFTSSIAKISRRP